MSSLKMTFSLTSLIFLIALGLVFVPTSVMAHDPVSNGASTPADTRGHPDGLDQGDHEHPKVKVSITDADAGTDGIQVVDTNADDNTADGTTDRTTDLTPTIQFDVTLTVPKGAEEAGDAGATTAVAANTFTVADPVRGGVEIAAYDPDFLPAGESIVAGTWTAGTGDKTREWTTTVTLTLAAVTGDDEAAATAARTKAKADAIEKGITVRVRVLANTIKTSGLDGGPTEDQANLESDTTASVIAPPDTTAPVLEATVDDADKDTGARKVTLAFDEKFTDAPSVMDSTPASSDIASTYTISAVTAVTAADSNRESFEVTVTPNAATAENPSYPAGTVTLTVSGTDDDGNEIPDNTTVDVELAARTYTDTEAPKVSLLSDPDRHAEPFTINFTASDNDATLEADAITVTVTPASAATAGSVMKTAGTADEWTVMITPTAATADNTPLSRQTISVKVTVSDGNQNGSATKDFYLAERTYTPPPSDDDDDDPDPPTATITVSEHMTDGDMATFRVRVEFTPATGGDDVTGFDHEGLTIKDSSTPARTVDVMPANVDGSADDEGNPHSEPLSGTNRYDGVLEYDTRHEYTYPLKVTIDQTAQKTHNPMESADVGMAAPTPETPDTRAVATLAGPAGGDLLGGEFQVSITFSKATTLTEGEILVTPASAGHVTVGSLSPASGSHTMFTVRIQPFSGAKTITVTVADNTRIKPATTNGSITDSAPIGTLNTITAPAEFGTAPFIAVFTFEAAPTNFMTSDISVTGGGVTDLTMKTGSMGKAYEAQITPTAGAMSVVIGLSATGMDKFSYSGTAKTVPKKAAPTQLPTPGDLMTSLSADEKTTTITSGRIAANGFAVIWYMGLPDLELFFDIGGSITLHDNDTADDANSRTVVISEILWGLDLGELDVAKQTKHQFIELYNTTGAVIDLAGWKLTYTEGNVRPAIDIDQVSNRGPGGWEVDTGDTGKSGRVTDTVATDATSLITPVDIVSMYRKIDYPGVVAQVANRGELVKKIPNGNAKGSWANSTRRSANRWIKSTPGAEHHRTIGILTASSVSGTPFRINEIGNDTDGGNDWIELYNHTDGVASLKNFSMSMVTAQGTDTMLFHFHDQDWKVPAKGYVVISTRHPRDTDLASGKDISIADDQEENKGASHLFVVKAGWNLQDNGKFTLILRNNHEAKHLKTGNHLVDVVATRQGSFSHTNTSLWPLAVTGLPHENVIDGGDENFAAGKVYQRNGGNGRGEKQFAVRGFTGVGYDRAAEDTASNGGTPGYDNGAIKEKVADLSDAEVTFSEIMLGLGEGRQNLPQWVEIYNSSMTQAVNLNGWKLHVENHADVKTALDAVLTLGNMEISPNQTVLIVTNTGRVSDPDHFPSNRVVNLWTTKAHRDALEMIRRTDQVFSTQGFNLQLYDKDNKLVDEAGNLDGNRRTRDELDNTWVIPMNGEDDERRSSLIRVYDAGIAIDGTMKEAWVLADETDLAYAISETYYGDPDDVGTPGFRGGGPLPVSLSKFRPERMKDTGEIVVRWVTESELNNAGFNILRSEKRDGEFTKVHFEAGEGTTSERTVYEWKDTSAKPNVVYYYQIQDISLDGEVTTLRTTHLRGNVTATGKATTTWGEIKALQ